MSSSADGAASLPARETEGGPPSIRLWRRMGGMLGRFLSDPTFRDKVHFLKKVYLFHGLSSRDISQVVARLMEKSYGEGEIIFQEGDVGRACFIVSEGAVEIFRADPISGREEQMGVFGPGDFFGEMVLLDELPRSATARTVSATRLHILYKSHFDVLLANHGRVALELLHNLARLLSARLRRQNEDFLSRTRGASPLERP